MIDSGEMPSALRTSPGCRFNGELPALDMLDNALVFLTIPNAGRYRSSG